MLSDTVPGEPVLVSTAFDLAPLGYVTEERFLSGTAFALAPSGPLGDDGVWPVVPERPAEFATRLVIYRPADPAAFNGTVVVEWLNCTSGKDIACDWHETHRHLMRNGYGYVGVSAQQAGVDGPGLLPGMGVNLRQADPARYGTLHHPGDAYCFDIFTKAAQAIRGVAFGERPVERLLAIGASLSAMMLVTYVNAAAPLSGAYDGYLLHARFGAAAEISGRAALNPAASVRIRTDLPAPVFIVQSETDVLASPIAPASRQPDHDRFRLWEVAGSSHIDAYMTEACAVDSGLLPLAELAAAMAPSLTPMGVPCRLPINSGPQMHYVLQAVIDHLDRWVRDGTPPPMVSRIALAPGEPPGFAYDALGNAQGGVRTPWVDVPTGVLSGVGQEGGPLHAMFGRTLAFDAAQLATLYPGGQDEYLRRFAALAEAAVRDGALTTQDLPEIVALAAFAWPQ